MREVRFDSRTVWESNTYYRFDPAQADIGPADTTSCFDKKYLTIPGGSVHATQLDTAFYLHDLENVTLDFGGAVITLHGKIQPFLLDRCRNITIKNVTVAYERALFSEFDILSRADGMLRTRPGKRFPCRVENGCLIPYAKEWESRDLHKNGCMFLQAYDKKTRDGAGLMVIYLGEQVVLQDSPPADNIPQIRVCADGDDILFFGDFPKSWDSTKSLVLEHEGRDISSAACYHSEHVTFERYRILNGAGMGIYAVYTTDLSLHEVRLYHDTFSHGIVTNAADGAHLVACKGQIRITDSVFEGTVDDALNVHANFYHTVQAKGTLIYARRSQQSHGLNAHSAVFGTGDEIAVYRGRTLEEKARFTVREMRITDDWTVQLTVDRPADMLCKEDIIENLSTNPELLIRGTRFDKSNANLRLQTRGKTVVENCFFTLPILLTGDMNYWFESSPTGDLSVRRCRFSDARATVRAIPEFSVTDNAPYYHHGITVEDCTFKSHVPLYAKACAGIRFLRNRAEDGKPLSVELIGCGDVHVQ